MTYPFESICGIARSVSHSGTSPLALQQAGGLFALLVQQGRYALQGPNNSMLLAEAGTLVVIPETARLEPADESALCGLCLQGAAAAAACTAFAGPFILPAGAAGSAVQLLQQLQDASKQNPAETSAAAYSLLCRLADAEGAKASLSPLVAAAVADIHERYAALFGIEELADALQVDKSYLIRRFGRETGTSPGRYLLAVRIGHARHLLAQRQYSLEMVAALCGFSSANYLCKAFKKECGETPTDFRNRTVPPVEAVPPGEGEGEMYLI